MRHLRPLIAATLAVCCCRTAVAATIPAPAAIPDQTAFLVVYIPDLMKTIDHLEQTAIAINPKTPKGMMKMGLGGMLGDPELAGFGKGPVALVLAPGMPAPSFALVLPTTNAQVYADALTKTGSMTKAVGGNLVVAKLPDGLELGERVAAKLGDIGATPVKGDVRMLIAFDRVMQSYGAFLSQMAMMAGAMGGKQPGQEQMAKLLPLYAAALQMAGGDVGIHQADIGFTADAITVESITEARADSPLAKAFAAPVPCLHASEQRLGPDGGVLLATMSFNRNALGGYAKHLLGELMKRPESKDLIPAEIPAIIDQAMAGYTGDVAVRMRSGTTNTALFDNQTIYQVADGQKAVDVHFRLIDLMFSDKSALGKMYQNMGITCTAKRDARAIGPTKVHTINMDVDAAKAPAGQAQQMKAMMVATELAVEGKFLFMAQGGPMEAMLKPAAQGPTLKARAVHGPGHHAYFDVDPVGFVLMFSKMMPMAPGGDLMDKLKQIPADKPFTGVMDLDAGRMRWAIHLPTKPMADLGKAFEGQRRNRNAEEDRQDNRPKDGATLF